MPSGHLRKSASFGELALWTAAGLVVFAAHAGAVMAVLREPPPAAADSAPPAAIMIELAAEPEAIETDETQLVPDEVDAEEIKTETIEPPKEPVEEPQPEPQPLPEPVEEPIPEATPEPEPEVVEKVEEPLPEPPDELEPLPEPVEEIDPIEEMALAQLENVEVPLPMARPPLPEKPKDKPKKVEKPAPAASQAARKAKAEVKQSNRVAASQTSSTAGNASVSPAKWQSRLMSHLERRKRYPSEARKKKEEGTAYVRFTIDTSGNVLSVSLSRSSGYPSLDQAVVDMVRRASPVPAPPPGANRTIVAPVRFNLR
ncbi:energy transducer TonB [Ciceribacter sp. L1K23]|uniref:energy transducer TonB n=1 Tax=Ciceribacter sp. L1K23 TaxID=2820276 RepID=UPI001B8127F5|nr:energy transducer TonB [Ciceribacter sp. L1K23]MBR0557775.1 energy transducer TonB [Ciceribacter sp. L1K23]